MASKRSRVACCDGKGMSIWPLNIVCWLFQYDAVVSWSVCGAHMYANSNIISGDCIFFFRSEKKMDLMFSAIFMENQMQKKYASYTYWPVGGENGAGYMEEVLPCAPPHSLKNRENWGGRRAGQMWQWQVRSNYKENNCLSCP